VNTQEEKVGEAGRHNFLSNVSVPHQVQTEERRMEIVKVNGVCYLIVIFKNTTYKAFNPSSQQPGYLVMPENLA
jgi:hypothetical protein